jgi:hypothetical protein
MRLHGIQSFVDRADGLVDERAGLLLDPLLNGPARLLANLIASSWQNGQAEHKE